MALAGCGGSSNDNASVSTQPLTKQQYGKALVTAARAANRDGQKAMDEIAAGNANGVADLKQSMRAFHDRLAQITPPPKAAKDHARLVRAAKLQADEFAAAIDKQDPKTVAALTPLTNMTRYKGGREVQQITAALDAKGYTVG